MVTIVLLVIWVCGAEPKHEDRINNNVFSFIVKHCRQLYTLMYKELIPSVVVDGTVLVATIGATVAAATGVTGLKMGFCGEQVQFSH